MNIERAIKVAKLPFSSPLSGTFFQYQCYFEYRHDNKALVFVPSLGDFFSICRLYETLKENPEGFRPLSRGLFFNQECVALTIKDMTVFVPSLGDFFSILSMLVLSGVFTSCFRPLSRGLFFNVHW